MSVVQLRFAFLLYCFNKWSPLLPIYGNRIQIVGMLFLFTMFFSCFGAYLGRFFNKDLRIYLGKPFQDINCSIISIWFFSKCFELQILEAQEYSDLNQDVFNFHGNCLVSWDYILI